MRDLTGRPEREVAAERARISTEGAGARLLALQADDGRWGGAAWNRGWDSTMHVLMLLRDLGLDPASDQARRVLGLVRERVTWQGCGPKECDGHVFFEGEVEPCINAQVGAVGAYFGQDVRGIVDRLLDEQLPDGGWNCEAPERSTRSSFNTTICVLEALLEYERAGHGAPAVTEARLRGQKYHSLHRSLLRLSLLIVATRYTDRQITSEIAAKAGGDYLPPGLLSEIGSVNSDRFPCSLPGEIMLHIAWEYLREGYSVLNRELGITLAESCFPVKGN